MGNLSLQQEKEYLALLKNGDLEAFECIYRHYAPKLATKLFQLVKSKELAQDLLQDIFMKIWEIHTNIEPEKSFASFLYKIATNESYNVFRSSIREQNSLLDVISNNSYNPVEGHVAYKELNKAFHDALNHLTPRQREIYVLHRLEGKSYSEIADLLHISISAINQHLQAATKHIRRSLRSDLKLLLLFFALLLQ